MHSKCSSYVVYHYNHKTGATTSVTTSCVKDVYFTKTLLSRAAAIKELKLLRALKALIKVKQSRALKAQIRALVVDAACEAATSSKTL
jgi:hypothetical protein